MPKRSLRWFVGRSLDAAIWRPSHALYMRDHVFRPRRNEQAGYSDRDHLLAAAQWLALELVKSAQSLDCTDPGIRGGIPSSAPVWGNYLYTAFPNWAARYFVDAMVAKGEALASSLRLRKLDASVQTRRFQVAG